MRKGLKWVETRCLAIADIRTLSSPLCKNIANSRFSHGLHTPVQAAATLASLRSRQKEFAHARRHPPSWRIPRYLTAFRRADRGHGAVN